MPPKKPTGSNAAKKNTKNKRQRSSNSDSNNNNNATVAASKKRKVEPEIEYEDLNNLDSWDWSEVPTSSMVTDDLGGFLCLEEIDDVHVEYEGDDTTGKVAKFKRVKKADRKTGKRAQPEMPLGVEDMKDFYDVDTFDEKLAAEDQKNRTEANDDDEPMSDEQPMEEDNENDDQAVGAAVDGNDEEEKEEEKPKEKPAKKDKARDKKMKKLEQLKKQMEQLEASLADEDKEKQPAKESKKNNRPSVEDIDKSVDVSAWKSLKLIKPIMNALKYNKFTAPTPIQQETLPLALAGRNVIGAAETGSGKTLAFGIPIVQHVAKSQERSGDLAGLILTPTRELAIQVKEHIEKVGVFADIKVAVIVGGMSIQKQQRMLKNKPDIIVATPGRLWEVFSGSETFMDMLKHIKYLVLDEADRMLEKGRFEELTNILDILSNKKQDTTDWPEESEGSKTRVVKRDLESYQTFVFTATLGKDIRYNIKSRKKVGKKAPGSMEDLLERLELIDKDPAIVDITTEGVVASRLVEAKIECLKNEKDLYVYYFVTRYPGRTIVFVNSIDALRRLIPIFKLLDVEVLGLHAQMQQKQRLKNLDRFKANKNAVLMASDVAARGLDIPLVDHVIHYQLPRSGEIYVHRSGRTARANHEGVSLLLCAPDELKLYTKLYKTLKKGAHYPDFPVDVGILNEMKKRVALATEIDKLEHREQKSSHDENWMRKMAEEMDVEFDEEEHTKPNKKSSKIKILNKKGELKHLLAQPMLPFGVSRKYITNGIITDLVDRLIENNKDVLLPAHAQTNALETIAAGKAN
ncbi:P-loop containing nucleoside triphosphate hydrolase protein [Zychaea mexicana]|uniref:P-loop containing nucleoside triphosphate hydrolase protein n=1 Tax=Zychaea mexicana TaxID=64656 RepID=UPI0022FE54BF|nr:P-loop containing nucleoside triphosphate hydrolase protein [Zychaea mexicana]KAI9476623.1 P-loop containing nucleoside triphosphate hydrolase protein [Zychaea mexicana]